MIKRIFTPTQKDIFNIPLEVYTTKNHKREFSGTMCNSIITFDIETSNGYINEKNVAIGWDPKNVKIDESGHTNYDNLIPVSLMYVWQCAVDAADGNIYILFGRTWKQWEATVKWLSISAAYQGSIGHCIELPLKGVLRDAYDQIVNAESDHGHADKHPVYNLNIYIHNLGFEYQHLRNIYNDEFAGHTVRQDGTVINNVFARTSRKPLRSTVHQLVGNCDTTFVDTLCLTQKSLATWGKDANLDVKKLSEPKGFYDPIRTPETPLTDNEWDYCENDVVTMVYGIRKYREDWSDLKHIPLTQTGTVRKKVVASVCKTEPFEAGEKHDKKQRAKGSVWSRKCARVNNGLTPKHYSQLRQLFCGGWTHANRFAAGRVISDVECYDFASSYPAVMTHMLFPVDEFKEVTAPRTIAKLENNKDLMDITRKKMWYARYFFKNLRLREGAKNDWGEQRHHTFWSSSKCIDKTSKITDRDNGKILRAETLDVYMTDVDWDTFRQVYTWDEKEVLEMYAANAALLPRQMIADILEYYRIKTSYKDVPGKESVYIEAKQWINSIYGAAVTRIIDDDTVFTKYGWSKILLDEKMFEDKKESMTPENTFLSYQIGIWVTAWARHNLWSFILPADHRVVYGDTDSLMGKFVDEDHVRFAEWDAWLTNRRQEINRIYPEITPDMYMPAKPNGELANLGTFEFECLYLEFKTLGAKRYSAAYNKNGEVKIKNTIAGLPKKSAGVHIKKPADLVSNLMWSPLESGKLAAMYNDNQPTIKWVDRDGKEYTSTDKYGTCLKPIGFTLTIAPEYQKLIELLQSTMWNNADCADETDPIFIKKALDIDGKMWYNISKGGEKGEKLV